MKGVINYIHIISAKKFKKLVLLYGMISRTNSETYNKSIKIIGMRLSNLYIIDVSGYIEWVKSPLLILLVIIIWWFILPYLTIKGWHKLIDDFGTNKKMNRLYFAYPNIFTYRSLFIISIPNILIMIPVTKIRKWCFWIFQLFQNVKGSRAYYWD